MLSGFWPAGPACVADIVNFNDFTRFAELWLETGSGLPADLDNDKDVDYTDLRLLVDEWLYYRCPYNWPLR
ncbi:MAG: hypothetical protein NTX52_10860 [Planctomycetota bacterium]|nr:hypothetical protein [Planctomycetota bacterium]